MTRILSVFNLLKRVGFAILLLGNLLAANADTTFVSGEIEEGVWDESGSPYVILDTSWVNEDIGLFVDSGVEIVFTTDSSRLWLAGHCSLIGTASDSIVLTLNASHSQFRSYRANTYSIELEYCKIVTTGGAGVALLADSVNVSHTSSIGMEHPFNDVFIGADIATLANSHFASLEVVSDTASLSDCTYEYSVRFEDGSVLIDSLFPIGEYADYSTITLWPSGANCRLNVSNVQCGEMNLDGTFSPGAQANLTEITATERLGNSINVAFFSSYSISNCSVNRVYNWLSSGTIERSKLYSFAIENTSEVVTISNCVFEIKECCQEEYPHGFITGTVTTDFSLYNNIFVSGDSSLPVVYYPTNDVIDARYNITVGMEDPWRGIVEGCCNFSASNLFDPHTNYGLRFDSPAINSGRLGQPDEDGSRSDIGIDWWDHRYDHPPTITTPDTIEVRWGDPLNFVLSATDEGPVTFPIVPNGPRWLTGPNRLDEMRDTLFIGTVPFGVSSFDVELGARDQLGQFDRESVHVKVYPRSVLLDTVRGTLTIEHSPYRFSQDVVVPHHDTLRIDPGVVILADSIECIPAFYISGTLIAEGSSADSIHFNSDGGFRWDGLIGNSGSSIVLDYVSFQYAGRAINSNGAVLAEVEHSTIVSPSTGIDLYFSNAQCTVKVRNVDFLNAAIFRVHGSSFFTLDRSFFDGSNIANVAGVGNDTTSLGIISNCKFTNFPIYPIQINSDSIVVERCLFSNIQSSRIIALGTSVTFGPIIQHNTFIGNDNQYIVEFVPHNSLTIRNNIFAELSYVVYVSSVIDTNSIMLRNNCFWNVDDIINQGSFYWPTIGYMNGLNANGDSVDFYSNLKGDPEFQDSLYLLALGSPCIDAGLEYGQEFYGEGPDIGAYEYDALFTEPWIRRDQENELGEDLSISVFPNPTNAELTILLPLISRLFDVQIYNILGQLRFSNVYYSTNSFGNWLHLSLSDWATGQYFIKVHTPHATLKSQFTIIR